MADAARALSLQTAAVAAEALPAEIIAAVLGWLPLRNRLAAMASCRRWYRVGVESSQLWRVLDLTDEEGVAVTVSPAALRRLASYAPVVQVLAARCFDLTDAFIVRPPTILLWVIRSPVSPFIFP